MKLRMVILPMVCLLAALGVSVAGGFQSVRLVLWAMMAGVFAAIYVVTPPHYRVVRGCGFGLAIILSSQSGIKGEGWNTWIGFLAVFAITMVIVSLASQKLLALAGKAGLPASSST